MRQSRWERLRQEVRDKDAEIARLRAALERSEQLRTAENKAKLDALNNLLKVEFEARVAKGCYASCPMGRIAS